MLDANALTCCGYTCAVLYICIASKLVQLQAGTHALMESDSSDLWQQESQGHAAYMSKH